MGTTLTGTTPQDTYDSLIKVTDNGPLSGTAKYLSDGLGNDSALALSTSQVGIGTTTPTYSLQVKGSGDTTIGIEGGASGLSSLNLGNTANLADGGIRYDNATDALILRANNAERLRITSAGNVGIGTSSPARKLDVTGTGRFSDDLTISGSKRLFLNGSTGQDWALRTNSSSGNFDVVDWSTEVSRVSITQAGNVGIGTSSPNTILDVNTGVSTSSGTAIMISQNTDGAVKAGASFGLTIQNGGEATNAADLWFRTASGGSLSERMRITSAGSVLVGTSSSDLTRNMIVAGTAGMAVQYAGNAGTYFDIAPAAANGAVTLTADARTGAYPDMIFRTSAAEQVRITSGGVLQLTQGQIKFPATQVASADANTLDDYEEGTFTPIVVGGATYDYQSGRYTKIGRMVQFEIAIGWSAGGGSGSLILGGLPFTSASSSTYPSLSISYFNAITLAAAGNVPMANVGNGTTTIGFNQIPSGGGSNIAISYSASGNIQISGTYSV